MRDVVIKTSMERKVSTVLPRLEARNLLEPVEMTSDTVETDASRHSVSFVNPLYLYTM